jgi:Pyridoxamine 5'-phosphate oxidase
MASWGDIEQESPDLAALVRKLFDAHTHKTIATLRRDGSPRISGTEVNFTQGELWIGSMWRAVKALDLQRDPRFALHSGSDDPDAGWWGDAKVAGRAEEITDPARVIEINGSDTPGGRSHLFRLDVAELVVVRLGEPADHLVIESWHAGRGVRSLRR